jgi:hypothetical protein
MKLGVQGVLETVTRAVAVLVPSARLRARTVQVFCVAGAV